MPILQSRSYLVPQDDSRLRKLRVLLAKHADEVKQAQELRYRVFAEELGADHTSSSSELDCDPFDSVCEHLLVRDECTSEIVGPYPNSPSGTCCRNASITQGLHSGGNANWWGTRMGQQFHCADFFVWLPANAWTARYRQHFWK